MSRVRLNWHNPNIGFVSVEGFKVFRSASPIDPESLPAPLAVLPPNVTEFDDVTALPGETYFYSIGCFVGGQLRVIAGQQVSTLAIAADGAILLSGSSGYLLKADSFKVLKTG
ncbi:MAG: hypothetical protein COA84_15060 [Robiginitomaculum sp.]|nr:MAG: hypothetical protein COA84_15060 [Robiginitomaculum sp.]